MRLRERGGVRGEKLMPAKLCPFTACQIVDIKLVYRTFSRKEINISWN